MTQISTLADRLTTIILNATWHAQVAYIEDPFTRPLQSLSDLAKATESPSSIVVQGLA